MQLTLFDQKHRNLSCSEWWFGLIFKLNQAKGLNIGVMGYECLMGKVHCGIQYAKRIIAIGYMACEL